MKNISDVREKCFGCTACYSACPTNAIEMCENEEGFLFPTVNAEKCISCGKCKQTCPAYIIVKEREINFYAFINQDENVLLNSTSGGFFSAAIEIYKPDFVCGAILDDNLVVRHVVTNSEDIIDKMKGSKYVQSILEDSFVNIQDKLLKGYKVLASGTSCQVQGLLNFLKNGNIPTENLLTIDLICHGVPSPIMFKDYLNNYIENTDNAIVFYKSRSKKYGWGSKLGVLNYLQTIEMSNSKVDNTSMSANLWQNAFFSDYAIRECCYSCPFCSPHKPSDITMGDFWGVENILPQVDYQKGCSLVICHSAKGRDLINGLSVIKLDEKQYNDAISKQSRLVKPIEKPKDRKQFWEDYKKMGFKGIAQKYFRFTLLNKFLMKLYIVLVNIGSFRIANKIARKIFY
jgi:coenzyme F420-reducing hydrogenase beta subunit